MRASAGSAFRLPLAVLADENLLLAALHQKKIALYAAMPRDGDAPACADLTGRTAIVIGSEGRGVNGTIAEKATPLRIPTSGVESLNAAVAAGVLLYEARRQRTTV